MNPKFFDKIKYEEVLRKSAGVLNARHIEWSNKERISKWLRKIRLQNERKSY